jgi:hypothetical protein
MSPAMQRYLPSTFLPMARRLCAEKYPGWHHLEEASQVLAKNIAFDANREPALGAAMLLEEIAVAVFALWCAGVVQIERKEAA